MWMQNSELKIFFDIIHVQLIELDHYYFKYAIIMYYVMEIEQRLFNRWRTTTI